MEAPAPSAIEENQRGNDARDAEDLAQAEMHYYASIASDAEFSSPWFNLGVIYKWQCRWDAARRCVERCLELRPKKNEGAIWNLGIVATALGDWPAARAAWKRYGIEIPDGEGPIEMNLGYTPIRLKLEQPEVVWCDRIDPARAIVRSVPSAPSGRRYRDLVLHDGEEVGVREYRGHDVPVFNELTLLASSKYQTHLLEVTVPSEEAYMELMEALDGDHEGNVSRTGRRAFAGCAASAAKGGRTTMTPPSSRRAGAPIGRSRWRRSTEAVFR